MATLTLKNVPDDLYARLKEAAARNRRSLNQEAIRWLENNERGERRNPDEIIADLRSFRSRLPRQYDVTVEQIDAWKRQGRE